MYLVDTNVWLERFLEQAKSDEVRDFLNQTPSDQLALTDFALHSTGGDDHGAGDRQDPDS